MTDENTTPPADRHGGIAPIAIEDELKRSYLDYAMSVIVSRALRLSATIITELPAWNRVPPAKPQIPRHGRTLALLLPRSGISQACRDSGWGLPMLCALSR